MSFRLVPKSVTLNDLERHKTAQWSLFCVISSNSVASGVHSVKVVEGRKVEGLPKFSATEM